MHELKGVAETVREKSKAYEYTFMYGFRQDRECVHLSRSMNQCIYATHRTKLEVKQI